MEDALALSDYDRERSGAAPLSGKDWPCDRKLPKLSLLRPLSANGRPSIDESGTHPITQTVED
jgi:hypothetical protein